MATNYEYGWIRIPPLPSRTGTAGRNQHHSGVFFLFFLFFFLILSFFFLEFVVCFRRGGPAFAGFEFIRIR